MAAAIGMRIVIDLLSCMAVLGCLKAFEDLYEGGCCLDPVDAGPLHGCRGAAEVQRGGGGGRGES